MFEKAIASVLLMASAGAAAQGGASEAWRNVGRPAAASEIAARNITAFPDGSGLPPGRGSVERGRAVFAAKCAACHGARAEGSEQYPPLAGGRGTLKDPAPLLTVGSYWPHATTLWDYTRRAMPYPEPGSLETDDVYAVTAYILHLNGLVQADAVIDQDILPRIRMPNRDGFVPDGRGPRPARR